MAEPVSGKKRARKADPTATPTMTSPAAISAFEPAVAAPPVTPHVEIEAASPAVPAADDRMDVAPAPAEPAASVSEDAVSSHAATDTPEPAPAFAELATAVDAAPDADAALPATPVEAITKPIAATGRIIAEPLTKGLHIMATTFDTTATTEKAKAIFGDINERAKSAMEKSAKMGEEMTEFTKGNVEAIVASGRVAAKGAETLAQDVAETMKKNFENATAQMKSIASVKSPTELFQLQSDFAKSYFDSAVADASKFTESMMKLIGDIAQPLSSRYAVAAEKIKTPGA